MADEPHPSLLPLVPATWSDREQAAQLIEAINHWPESMAQMVRVGVLDENRAVQAFARQRIQLEAICHAQHEILTAKLSRADDLIYDARTIVHGNNKIEIADWLHHSADHLNIPRT